MGGLSDVSMLFGQRAGDLEKAREIFTAEARAFVSGILAGVQRARSDPWTAPRVRIDLPRDIETESYALRLSLELDLAQDADRDRLVWLYRHAKVHSQVTHGDRATVDVDVPRRLLDRIQVKRDRRRAAARA